MHEGEKALGRFEIAIFSEEIVFQTKFDIDLKSQGSTVPASDRSERGVSDLSHFRLGNKVTSAVIYSTYINSKV